MTNDFNWYLPEPKIPKNPKSKVEQVLDIIQHEPNYETFEYKGYKIVIKRMMFIGGQLNGYVRIPKAHKYYRKSYDDMNIECHGGLTFAGDLENDGDEDFYIGFDTAHYQDYMPFMIMMTRLGPQSIDEGTYKDINYVRNECKNIVKQLIAIE